MAAQVSFFNAVAAIASLIFFLPDYKCSAYGHSRKLVQHYSPVNSTLADGDSWSAGGATWYGAPEGFGSDGGACGYGKDVGLPPYSSMISAGGPSLFKSGKGCGACYQVKCTENPACSGNPVTVVISDECPGGPCTAEATHFDLSGTAFGAMANPGQADLLRNAGNVAIQFTRASCSYSGVNIAFRVDSGSTANYLAVLVEFENGDGDLSAVELLEAGSTSGMPMQQSSGAIWKINSPSAPLKAPFSIRVTSSSGKSVLASDVIPAGYTPGTTYKSSVNF